MITTSEVSDQPMVDDGVERQLDPRHIAVQRLIGWIFSTWIAGATLIVLLIAWLARVTAIGSFTHSRSLVWLAGTGLLWIAGNAALAWHFQRWPRISYRHTSYRVDRLGIEIRRGVFWRSVTNVPRTRVQHTDVSQGPLERRYGLGTLVIYTAGTDHARVSLSGLDHQLALSIREHLLPREAGDAV
jgi:membrane protein YdbS with pleckstrin-like domain